MATFGANYLTAALFVYNFPCVIFLRNESIGQIDQ